MCRLFSVNIALFSSAIYLLELRKENRDWKQEAFAQNNVRGDCLGLREEDESTHIWRRVYVVCELRLSCIKRKVEGKHASSCAGEKHRPACGMSLKCLGKFSFFLITFSLLHRICLAVSFQWTETSKTTSIFHCRIMCGSQETKQMNLIELFIGANEKKIYEMLIRVGGGTTAFSGKLCRLSIPLHEDYAGYNLHFVLKYKPEMNSSKANEMISIHWLCFSSTFHFSSFFSFQRGNNWKHHQKHRRREKICIFRDVR